MLKQRPINYILFASAFLFYCLFSFYIHRHQTSLLLVSFGALFLSYLWISHKTDTAHFSFWLYAAIIFRFCFLFALPPLSDDFYRFIWDGRLLAAGHHPFAELPRYYIENKIFLNGIDASLFENLNSPDYFTIYPPVNQFIFWLSAKLFSDSTLGSVIIMRSFILAAEIGTLWVMQKIVAHYQLPKKRILLYALNPLVIIELTGNLHFEALMIFFLLLSYWLLIKEKIIWSALFFSLAICTKLLPVLLLPLLLVRLGWKKSIIYYLAVGLCCTLLFFPLLNAEIIEGFRESIGYYFKKFEFNASLYYLVREWGYWRYGYNIIQTVGIRLAMYCASAILLYTIWDFIQNSRLASRQAKFNIKHSTLNIKHLTLSSLFILTIYFAFATTVHPWYITSLLALSIFTKFRFSLVWTGLIFLTYLGYSQNGYSENLWVTTIEYVIVIGYLAYEVIWKKENSFV
jgi:alpha-1,6-mannosyltransferase